LRRVAHSTLVLVVTILTASCAGVVGAPSSSPSPATQSISVSPSAASVRAGGTQQFTANVTGVSNPQLTWSVNDAVGGNPAIGTIVNTGALTAAYSAPMAVPATGAVTIKAAVVSSSSLTAAATANLLNPVPQLSAVTPSQLNVGSFTITVSGTSFVNGAVVNLGSAALATNFVSDTELTASGIATSSEVGNMPVVVTNPNPGSAISNSLNAQIISGPTQLPQISISPSTINVPAGSTANASLTVSGSPTPSVSCTVSGAGTAQISGSTVGYSAPNVVPAGGQSTITCSASNAAGSAIAAVTADISTLVPEGYTGPIPSTYFGMHILNRADWPTVPIGALGKATGVVWPYVEPAKGQYNWALLDEIVDEANANGIGAMYSSEGVPPWAAADQSTCTPQVGLPPYCTSAPSNLQDWDAFVTQLVTRYRGRIQIYELWNEPSQRFTGTMTQLVALTQHEHDVIRSIDPASMILSPAVVAEGYAYLDSYFATGGTMDIDAVAMHGYPDPRNDIAEMITQSETTTIRTVMSKYGLSAKPLWNTEASWGPQNKGATTDPDLQAAFVARAYFLNWSMGISRFYWYAWDSPVVGTLWTSGSAPSEPAIAYAQVQNWINGATMSQPCSINGAASAYHAVYTCNLARGNGYQALAVWNTDGTSTFTAPDQYVHYRDLQGNVVDVPTNHQVTIGLKPILLEN
jgi:hypothetical protein